MASSRREREAREARSRIQAYAARQEVHQHDLARRRRDNFIAVAGVIVVAAVAVAVQTVYFTAGPGAPTPEPSASHQVGVGVPDPGLAENRVWTGEMVINGVTLGIDIDGAAAPQAASAFLADIADEYYSGKSCHRLSVDVGFQLLQCGSIDGSGGADPDFVYGPIENAPADGIYPAGTIAIARGSGDAASNGHQFFIVYGDSSIPDDAAGGYTVVGHVTSGLDAFIAAVVEPGIDPDLINPDGTGAPAIPVRIESVVLTE